MLSTLAAAWLSVSVLSHTLARSTAACKHRQYAGTGSSRIVTCDAEPPPPELAPILAHALLHSRLPSLACDSLLPAIIWKYC